MATRREARCAALPTVLAGFGLALTLACTKQPSPSPPGSEGSASVELPESAPGESITVFGKHALCVRLPTGPVHCVGSNYQRQLGSTGERFEVFTESDRFLADDVSMHLGNSHGCAVNQAGAVRCWGSPLFGRRGDGCVFDKDAVEVCDGERVGADAERYRVVVVEGLPPIAEVHGGWDHTCALGRDGSVWCWGGNIDGQVGDVSADESPRPHRVALRSPVVQLASGAHHNCAVDDAAQIWCWGHPSIDGRESGSGDVRKPKQFGVLGPDKRGRLALTMWGACAVGSDGAARCWGQPALDEGGPVTSTDPWVLEGVTDVVGATDYSCVLRQGGSVECWSADAGFLGGDPDEDEGGWGTVALPFAGAPVGLVATLSAACAWSAAGELACWGARIPGFDDDLQPGVTMVEYPRSGE